MIAESSRKSNSCSATCILVCARLEFKMAAAVRGPRPQLFRRCSYVEESYISTFHDANEIKFRENNLLCFVRD